jgi:hypothetical protein
MNPGSLMPAVAAVLIAAGAPARLAGADEAVLSVHALNVGRYAEGTAAFARSAAPVDAGRLIESAQQVARVPRVAGEHFGFCFEVNGLEADGRVELRKVVAHPSLEVDGQRVEGYVTPVVLVAAGGAAQGCIGHTLSAEDAVAGTWRIALGRGETLLVEYRYFVQ